MKKAQALPCRWQRPLSGKGRVGMAAEAEGMPLRDAVADAQQRFGLLVAAVQEYAIFLLDPAGTVISWNPGAKRLKGYAGDEIIGRNFAVFYPDEDRQVGKPAAELEHARRHGSLTDDGWRVRKDGTRFWAHVVLTALCDDDGGLRGFAKVTRDDSAARAAREREAALGEITGALLAGRSGSDVLDLLVVRARQLVGARGTWITGTDPAQPSALRVLAADGDIALPVGSLVPLQGTVSEKVMDTGQPAVVADLPAVSSARRWLDGHGSALVVPLVAGDASLGVLVASMSAGGPILDESDLDLVRPFGREAAVVLGYQQLQEELRQQEIIEDRQRIARDLHDHVIQLVFAAGLTAQSAASRTAEEPVRDLLDSVVDRLDEAIRQLRTAVFELQPSDHPHGLRQAVLTICRQATRPLGFQPTVRFVGPVDTALPEPVAEHAVAAVREMLSNVARHAQAGAATVTVAVEDGLVVDVTDDGIGPPEDLTTGTGLSNLRARAAEVGGGFDLTSGPADVGSRAVWRAPLPH
jgi:PAS domain S-box-containing protein